MKEFQQVRTQDIQQLQIRVTEEIERGYVFSFLLHHFEKEKVYLHNQMVVYFYFHPPSLHYEVTLFSRKNNTQYPEFFTLKAHHQNLKNLNVVFVSNSYFYLFIQNQFITFKELQNNTIDEIKTYIEQVYEIVLHDLIPIQEDTFQKSSLEYEQNIYPQETQKFVQLRKKRSYPIFLFFCGVVTITFLIIFQNIHQNQNNTHPFEKEIVEPKSFHQKNNKFEKLVIPFLEDIANRGIYLQKIQYQHQKIKVILFHPQKEHLLKILSNKQYRSKVEKISFDSQNKQYIMEMSIEFA